MKRMKRLLFALLACFLLTTSVFADMGPKAQLIVRVKNAPDEIYYLDLLEQDTGRDLHNYEEDVLPTLHQPTLSALLDAIPKGWHGCLSEGVRGAPIFGDLTARERDGSTALHPFSYHGVPTTYRIAIATESGEVFVSDAYTREVLQSSVTLDRATKSVKTPALWVGYVLQFASTLVPTLLVEGLLLALFRLWNKRNFCSFLLVNLFTQGILAVVLTLSIMENGVNFLYLFLLVPAELVILLFERGAYRVYLDCTPKKATAYAVTANLTSAILGYFIMEPVWRFVVSIS